MDRSSVRSSFLKLRGARTHNLKNVNLDLPLYRTIAITGPSGSGKSSLAYDTIFAESQRQYVESLTGRSRHFLRKLERPDLDSITGLPPAVAISQRRTEPGSRATVATITEIYDYLRLLFARCASARCYRCGRVVQRQTLEQIQSAIKALPPNTRFMLLAPIIRDKKGSHADVAARLIKANYTKARVDGAIYELNSVPTLDPNVSHSIEVIIDRLVLRDGIDSRLGESLRLALQEGKGFVYCMFEKERVQTPDGGTRSVWKDMLFSERFSCPKCDVSYSEFEPRTFSFNSPYGACPNCAGYGRVDAFSIDKLIADPGKSVSDGAFAFGKSLSKTSAARVDNLFEQFRKLDPQAYDEPIGKWDENTRKFFFYGAERKQEQTSNLLNDPDVFDASVSDVPDVDDLIDGEDSQIVGSDYEILAKVADAKRTARLREEKLAQKNRDSADDGEVTQENFPGLIETLEHILTEASDKGENKRKKEKAFLLSKRGTVLCEECGGDRLRREARFATVGDKRIGEVTAMNVVEAEEWFRNLTFNELDRVVAEPIVERILARLETMKRLRLEYLSLDRAADSLSGGELQRARLTTALGAGLSGVCYILDEPTTGLHPRDTERLIQVLNELKDRGDSVIVVEHNEQVARSVDWLVDVGPGAGVGGGEIVAQGTPEEVQKNEKSLTGRVLSGLDGVATPTKRRRMTKSHAITLEGARTNNLKNITVTIPLGLFVCVTGVSGSGKSSLIKKTLAPALKKKGKLVNHFSPEIVPFEQEASYAKILGASKVDKLIEVDQSPIGRPSSVPATYSGVFDEIRKLFAELRESKAKGFKAGRFSFNISGGRCEECRGQGVVKLDSPFLPDAYAICPKCEGKRFNSKTLQVKFKGKSIADVLDMSFDEAAEFFADFPLLKQRLASFQNLGLGYMTLGRSAATLSGGEAQRIKLATELARAETGKTIYVLDEPTSGLHPSDVKELLKSLQKIVDEGNTVVVIEHSLDVMRVADWIIDLGPEGGERGGMLLAEGTPEDVASLENNETARFLKDALKRSRK